LGEAVTQRHHKTFASCLKDDIKFDFFYLMEPLYRTPSISSWNLPTATYSVIAKGYLEAESDKS